MFMKNKTLCIVCLLLFLITTPQYRSSAARPDNYSFKREILTSSRMRNFRYEQIKDSLKIVYYKNWSIAMKTKKILDSLLKTKY